MRKMLLVGTVALFLATGAAQAKNDWGTYCGPHNERCDPSDAEDNNWDDPSPTSKPARFRPWQQVWQCNDIRVTVTARDPFSIEYDLGGTIWGGAHFTVIKGALYFNERPCLPLQPAGY